MARRALSLEKAGDCELCVVLADEDMVCSLNKRYLGRDGPTDVMAFGQEGGPHPVLGDVVVCVAQASRQARRARHSLDKEVCLLTIHGILHLVGWRDDTPGERRRMMRRANQIWRACEREGET